MLRGEFDGPAKEGLGEGDIGDFGVEREMGVGALGAVVLEQVEVEVADTEGMGGVVGGVVGAAGAEDEERAGAEGVGAVGGDEAAFASPDKPEVVIRQVALAGLPGPLGFAAHCAASAKADVGRVDGVGDGLGHRSDYDNISGKLPFSVSGRICKVRPSRTRRLVMSLTTMGPKEISKRLYRTDKVHEAVASPALVDESHKRFYLEKGFLAVNNVFSPGEVEAAKTGLSFLIGGGKADFTGVQFEEGVDVSELSADEREPYVRKLMWFVEHEARLKALAAHATLLKLASWLVGDEVRLIQDMALLKPANIGREKPWHQDDAYFMLEPLDGIIGTWKALDAATTENGCMQFVPGSHKLGAKPHYHDRDCQIADEDVDVSKVVAVPLSPGGVVLFSGLVHHGTPPNQSAARRRALQYHYASVKCRSTTADEHGKFFYDAKGMAACTGMKPRSIADKF